jgi:hypothetical protein
VTRSPAHHPSRQTYGLEQKGDGPVTPSEPEPSPGRSLARFRQGAAHELLAYPWKEFPNGLEGRGGNPSRVDASSGCRLRARAVLYTDDEPCP